MSPDGKLIDEMMDALHFPEGVFLKYMEMVRQGSSWSM